MRSRVAFISIALAATTLALPFLAHAASIPFFGPIILDGKVIDQSCALGWGALILVINNIIRLLITITIIFIAPLVIAYSGFLLVVNSMNPGGKEQAKHMIQNLVIGLVVALAAWLIVDAIMAVLYNKQFGNWYDIITTGGQVVCIPLATDLSQRPAGTSGTQPLFAGSPLGAGPIQNTFGACTADALRPVWGPKAEAMSCVTHYEDSTCNPRQPSGTDIGADGSPISIGIFQINLSADDLNYPQCEVLNGGRPLNCTSAFQNGVYTAQNHKTTVGDLRLYSLCVDAASTIGCNMAAAQKIFNAQGLSGWGTRAQQSCNSLLATNTFPGQEALASVLVSIRNLFGI